MQMRREKHLKMRSKDHFLYFNKKTPIFIRLGDFCLQQQQETCYFISEWQALLWFLFSSLSNGNIMLIFIRNCLAKLDWRGQFTDRNSYAERDGCSLWWPTNSENNKMRQIIDAKPTSTIVTTTIQLEELEEPEEGECLFHLHMWAKGTSLHFIDGRRI